MADEAYAVENAVPELKTLATGIIAGNNDDELVDNLIGKIEELKAKLDVPPAMKPWFDAHGIGEETFLANLDELSVKAYDDQCTGANPRYPLISEIKDLYLKAYYGK